MENMCLGCCDKVEEAKLNKMITVSVVGLLKKNSYEEEKLLKEQVCSILN